MKRRHVMRLLGGGLAVGTSWTAFGQAAGNAQPFPIKPIRIVVPFPPGGAMEFLVRPLGRMLSERLGQPVTIDNRPGANTVIGAENVANSPADGYTLLGANEAGLSLAPAFAPITNVRVPYNAASDFSAISLLGQYGSIMCISPQVPPKTLREFIDYALGNPGKLSYASFGIGSQPQVMMEIFNHQAGIETVHVPYKGAAPAAVDLAAGHVQAMISAPSSVMAYIREGRLRALAYSGSHRLPELPDVPTFAEAGMPDFEARGWFGILARSGTPEPIRKLLSSEIWSIVQTEEYRTQAILANGFEVPAADPVEFQKFLADDMQKWKTRITTVQHRLS